jgi:hypothetical protein
LVGCFRFDCPVDDDRLKRHQLTDGEWARLEPLLASMIQGRGELVTDLVVPVFSRGVWFAVSGGPVMLPDVLGAAPAPTAPGQPPSGLQGRGGWSGRTWQGA